MSRERLEPKAISPLERQLLIAGAAGSSQSKPQIQSVGASPLLSQLKQFLPKMQQANVELQQKLQACDPSELDIEHIPEQEGSEGQVIQMDLACGVLELHDAAAVAAAQRAIASGADITVETYDRGSSSSGSGSDSDSDSESESDSEGGSDLEATAATAAAQGVAGSSAAPVKAAAAVVDAAAAAADAMDEDSPLGATAAAEQQQQPPQEQQQQQQGKQRRKLKPKRPMIEELP